MSTASQAPGLTLNLSRCPGVKNSGEETAGNHVAIYCNEDTHIDTGHHEVVRLTKRCQCKHTATISVLGFLYLLILAGIFMRYISVTLDRENLMTDRDQLVQERHKLNAQYVNLSVQLEDTQQMKKDYEVKLEKQILVTDQLSQEKDQVQTRYDNLSAQLEVLRQAKKDNEVKLQKQSLLTEQLVEERLKLRSEYDELSAQLEVLQQMKNDNEAKLEKLNLLNDQLSQKKHDVETRYQDLNRKQTGLKREPGRDKDAHRMDPVEIIRLWSPL